MFILKFTILICFVASSFAAKFPDNFMFGAGTSAYQIEGGWNEDGKGPSVWDTRYHSLTNATENGDVACDSYHKWREDVANAKELGLDFYRFSISWPRVLPSGTLNNINQKGVDYYLNLIKALKDEGIEPVVTLFHWDMPQHISDNGGLLNTQFVDYFEDFARLCYQLYGSYVKYWLTFNEPTVVCAMGDAGFFDDGNHLVGDGVYQCSYVLLKAHARAYRIYEEEFKANYGGQVGIVLNIEWGEPETDSALDLEAQDRYLQFNLGWWANPVFLGNWPQVMIDRIANRSRLEGLARSRLPEFTQEEIDYINGTHDFFAFNGYGILNIKYQEDAPIDYPSRDFDLGVATTSIDYPQGFRHLVNYINDRYQPGGIICTENGFGNTDSLNDTDRIDKVKSFLSNFLDAIVEDNVNMFGYSIWSLMDNFEWATYARKFGIIRVDFDSPNRTRTWKASASWYQQVAATHSLDN